MAGLFSIGYTAFAVDGFISALKDYAVRVVIDVRSQPYSANHPDYNKESMEYHLKRNNIYYRNYANEFGARQTDRCFFTREGFLDFGLFVKSDIFKQGAAKIAASVSQGYSVAFMCAEKDPAARHRAIMVSRAFYDSGIFGNTLSYLGEEDIKNTAGTLRYIDASNVCIYWDERNKCRTSFDYGGVTYTGLPMTDSSKYTIKGSPPKLIGEASLVVSMAEYPPYRKFVATIYPKKKYV